MNKEEVVFTKESINDAFVKWYQKIWLWILPTKEQWTNEGFVVIYKEFRGKIYIIKLGKITYE